MSRQHAEVVSRKFHCDQNHTFFTMFPSSYHHEMFRSYYHGQKWCPCKRSMSKAKVTEVNTPHSHFWTVTPVWIRILQWNHAHSLNQHRRGVLLSFKVICQISRSQVAKKSPISTRIWCFRTVTPAWNDPWWRPSCLDLNMLTCVNFLGKIGHWCLTHLSLVRHICVNELGRHWFR